MSRKKGLGEAYQVKDLLAIVENKRNATGGRDRRADTS